MDDIRITRGSTYDDAGYLSPQFLNKVRELYEAARSTARSCKAR